MSRSKVTNMSRSKVTRYSVRLGYKLSVVCIVLCIYGGNGTWYSRGMIGLLRNIDQGQRSAKVILRSRVNRYAIKC